MSTPPQGCSTPACQEKVILNSDNAGSITNSLCSRIEQLPLVGKPLPDLTNVIIAQNAAENIACLRQALYLDAVDYHGPVGRMLQFTDEEKTHFLDLCRQLNPKKKD